MKKIKAHSQLTKRLMATALALSISAPYLSDGALNIANSLKAYAEGYNGGGSSFGSPATTSGTSDGAKDYGFRVYIYDYKTGQIPSDSYGQMVVDIVPSNFRSSYATEKGTATRFGTVTGSIDRVWGTYEDDLLSKVYSGTGTISCTGSGLANHLKYKDGNDNYVNMTYFLAKYFETDKLTDTCYAVIEPTLLVNNCYYDSWQGYVEGGLNGNLEADTDDVRNLQVAGDGFMLTSNDTNLDINKPSDTILSMEKTGREVSDLRHTGYGIHLFNLKDMPGVIPDTGVINSYNIDSNPTSPDKSETPSQKDTSKEVTIQNHTVELQNSGEKNVIKVYMDAYVDKQASGLSDNKSGTSLNEGFGTAKKYTAIVQTGVFGTTQTTDKVVIQDEYSESGYHVV